MRTVLSAALALLFSAGGSHAQLLPVGIKLEPIQTEYMEVGSTIVEPGQSETPSELPDAPIAKTFAPACPAGSGRPCALLGGHLYLGDRFRLSSHDRSWRKAILNPVIVGMTAVELAAFTMDYKTTRYCLDRHLGREGNPLMGQSRAQELGVGIGVLALSTFAASKLKQRGEGPLAVMVMWAATVVHTYEAYKNAETCGY